ncbi:DDE-type integrase/transposase/recombinase [Microaerobacter geothermalis]|uniref:DDE-type integrase/transposase/recombinase n=1 Tax=Microaerobacter geothermalis TaxID=674972 RepID=UPI001F26077C|nr:DDE-type integrase/transposase/recombinase [Microaerobacter geothermalis]MCF6094018.1 DDE-type integrase/transposase/recombinase [Microaerobacter geothermalis]
MITLLSHLLSVIFVQQKIIVYLIGLFLGKSLTRHVYDEPVNKPYRPLQVNALPVIKIPEKLDYKTLLLAYEAKHEKPLKLVKRHQDSKVKVPNTLTCPRCQAPHEYLYDNTGGRGQFWCKVCDCRFNFRNYYSKAAILKCPHCLKTLEKIKERKDFWIFKCKHDDCPFYLRNLQAMNAAQKRRFQEVPHEFKVHYLYRQFQFNYKPLDNSSPVLPKVDLSRIHVSAHTLGLIMTYHVNYGMSARKTAALMKNVHGLSISHQTVINYSNAVALILKPFVDRYPYELSGSFCGDETYIRVEGQWHYLFFFFDTVKKVILSYPVSPKRDTLAAIKALDQVLQKFNEIPQDLTFVVDGNPIYILAQHYFAQHGIHFDIHKVIGLTNEDPVSTEYRPLKQIIERLNRTFKGDYRQTYGFGSQEGSVTFVTLFVTYFNFLRPHAALEGKVPVTIPELAALPHMPARWCKLIDMAQGLIIQEQSA